MRFVLVFLAAMVASGSSQNCSSMVKDGLEVPKSKGNGSCVGPECSCICSGRNCAPCPSTISARCLICCGWPECPCLKKLVYKESAPSSGSPPHASHRAEGKKGRLSEGLAYTISTIYSSATGPLCSAFNIKPFVVVTMSSCISGKDIKDLYVVVSGKDKKGSRTQAVKVLTVLPFTKDDGSAKPVVLILEKPTIVVEYLVLSSGAVDPKLSCESQKWQITNEGMNYAPVISTMTACKECNAKDKQMICATSDKKTRMSWKGLKVRPTAPEGYILHILFQNDIGTPLIEVRDQKKAVRGIYGGHDLFERTATHKYLSLTNYSTWFEEVLFSNP